ncbi:MAG: zinc ribbon domain-containing protein [Parasutterella sp.]
MEVSEVNPAYSSRECPRCRCTDKENRQGNSFKCLALRCTTDMLTWLLR